MDRGMETCNFLRAQGRDDEMQWTGFGLGMEAVVEVSLAKLEVDGCGVWMVDGGWWMAGRPTE